jgi:hypothetical protein
VYQTYWRVLCCFVYHEVFVGFLQPHEDVGTAHSVAHHQHQQAQVREQDVRDELKQKSSSGFNFFCKKNNQRTVPEFIDPVFAKTSPKRSFSVIENERFLLVFANTGSIISGTGGPRGGHVVQTRFLHEYYSVVLDEHIMLCTKGRYGSVRCCACHSNLSRI